MGINVDGAGPRSRAKRVELGSLLTAGKEGARLIAGTLLYEKGAERLNFEGYGNADRRRVATEVARICGAAVAFFAYTGHGVD